MTFNQITTKLLSYPNCALLIGAFWVEDLHTYVKDDIDVVRRLFNTPVNKSGLVPMNNPYHRSWAKDEQTLYFTKDKVNEICNARKAQLLFILNNYPNAKRYGVGAKRPR